MTKGPLRGVRLAEGQARGRADHRAVQQADALDLAGQEPPFPAEVTPRSGHLAVGGHARAPSSEGGRRRADCSDDLLGQDRRVPALDGDLQKDDYAFTAETDGRASCATPYQAAKGLKPDATFELYFDQSVDLAGSQKYLAHCRQDKKPFTAEKKDPTNDKLWLSSRARRSRSRATSPSVKGASGQEGPLPLEAEQSFGFETYGPLTVEEVRCGYEQARHLTPRAARVGFPKQWRRTSNAPSASTAGSPSSGRAGSV
jgi:hypothetical protein